jgi:hypothetical protein
MSDAELSLPVPGVVLVELNLDDRGEWPGMKVTEWVRKGRGWRATTTAPLIVWRGVVQEIEGRIENERVDTNATRTALRRFAVTLRQELGA